MDRLSAQIDVEHEKIVEAVRGLREAHEADAAPDDGALHLRSDYGRIRAEVTGSRARFSVFAADATSLSYMKMAVAYSLERHLGSLDGLAWRGDGSGSATPPFFREIAVMRSERIAPRMQRVRFAIDDAERFARGDLHVRLLLPPVGRSPVWPTLGPDGLLRWPAGEDRLTARVYTIRAIDVARGLVDVDFALHPGGETPAATFAETARLGDRIGMIGPGGGGVPDTGDLILLGDDTALPAIARILESLPDKTGARAFIEVDRPDDIQPLAGDGEARVTWLFREGRAPGTAGLLAQALRGAAVPAAHEQPFVWSGSEFEDFRAIRAVVRKEWKLPRERHLVVPYWRRGVRGEEVHAA